MGHFSDFQNLMQLQIADTKAHVLLPVIKERIRICEQWGGEYGKNQYASILAQEKHKASIETDVSLRTYQNMK